MAVQIMLISPPLLLPAPSIALHAFSFLFCSSLLIITMMATRNLKPAALSFEGTLSFDMLFSMLYFTMKKCGGLSIHAHCFSSLVPLLSNNFRLATNFVLYLCHWYCAKVFGFKSLKPASPSFSNPVLFHLFNTGCYSLVSYISI